MTHHTCCGTVLRLASVDSVTPLTAVDTVVGSHAQLSRGGGTVTHTTHQFTVHLAGGCQHPFRRRSTPGDPYSAVAATAALSAERDFLLAALGWLPSARPTAASPALAAPYGAAR